MKQLVVVVTAIGMYQMNSFELSFVNIIMSLFFAYVFITGVVSLIKHYFKDSKVILVDRPVDVSAVPRVEHDKKRFDTYPFNHKHANTWYHLCDAKELDDGRVVEVRALDKVFAVWKKADGTPVCQDAFCLHLGANLAVGGKIVNDCIECPFHRWKFNSEGAIVDIPYIKDPTKCPKSPKLKTYPCVDWCGLICVYYHSNLDTEPEFKLPRWVQTQLKDEKWKPHLSWDIGHVTLTPTDWVDQAGDHAHFHTLHADFLVPYTLLPIPQWLLKLVPLGICHELCTYKGDDDTWKEKMKEIGMGNIDKHLIYFTDKAGLTWKKEPMQATMSETLEMYIGPAMMSFHIPFSIGTFKVFVSTTPCEGGSIMRARTWIDSRVQSSIVTRCIAWILTGVSASQLASDIDILQNKIRLRKPILQPFDGPYNRTNAWLRMFYTENDKETRECGYANSW